MPTSPATMPNAPANAEYPVVAGTAPCTCPLARVIERPRTTMENRIF
jgi:hypothetical protein